MAPWQRARQAAEGRAKEGTEGSGAALLALPPAAGAVPAVLADGAGAAAPPVPGPAAVGVLPEASGTGRFVLVAASSSVGRFFAVAGGVNLFWHTHNPVQSCLV